MDFIYFILSIILVFVFAKITDRNEERKKCKNYLTGRIRYTKTSKGALTEVEHYRGKKTFYKKATINEINYIKSIN